MWTVVQTSHLLLYCSGLLVLRGRRHLLQKCTEGEYDSLVWMIAWLQSFCSSAPCKGTISPPKRFTPHLQPLGELDLLDQHQGLRLLHAALREKRGWSNTGVTHSSSSYRGNSLPCDRQIP